MFAQVFPSVFSKDLLKYIILKQDIANEEICKKFIDQIVEETCRQANKNKLKNYKVEKKIYTLNSTKSFYKVKGSKCIILNLKTSPELGEAYPGYLSKENKENNTIECKKHYALKETDAYFIEEKEPYIIRPACKHKHIIDLFIVAD